MIANIATSNTTVVHVHVFLKNIVLIKILESMLKEIILNASFVFFLFKKQDSV